MAILKKLIISSLPLLLTGCYEDFDPQIDAKTVLCINSLISAGEPIEVSVTHTWVFTDEKDRQDHLVNDATVKIYANGNLTDSTYRAQEGDVIKIEAYSPTYGAAEAEVAVPVATQISDIIFSPSLTHYWYVDHNEWGLGFDMDFDLAITISIPNDYNAERFYSLKFSPFVPDDDSVSSGSEDNDDDTDSRLRWSTPPSSVNFYEGQIYCNDPFFTEFVSTFDDVMDYGSQSDCAFFSNAQFDGESEDLHIGFHGCNFRISQWDRNPELLECGIKITLYSISKSYYNWINYSWQSDESIMADFINVGLAEPIWGYSNVSTGAGVVAAQSCTVATINLREFLEKTLSSFK